MSDFSTDPYKKIVNTILKDDIVPLFKERGFNINKKIFSKIGKNFVKCVELEFARFNSFASFSFWFNVEIYYGDFIGKKRVSKNSLLKDGTNIFFQRMGLLWNEENHMYTMNSLADQNDLSIIIQKDLKKNLFPFFEMMNSVDAVMNYLIAENERLGTKLHSFNIAIMLAKAGRKEESKIFFNESNGVRDSIKKAALFYGVELDDDEKN